MSSRLPLLAASLVTTLLLPVSWGGARADWVPNGNPTGAPAWWGADPSVADDGSGGAFVAWGLGVCAGIQHFDRAGEYAPGWPSAGLPTRSCDGYSGTGPIGDRYTRVVPDGTGGVYVVSNVWPACVSCNADPMYLQLQRLSGDGEIAPGWPARGLSVISQPWLAMLYRTEAPRMAANCNDGVFLAWQAWSPLQFDVRSGPLYVQSIGPDGTRRWGEQGLLLCDATRVHSSPEIVPDGHGGAFVFWCDQPLPDPEGRVFGQHVTAAGTISWAQGGVPVSDAYRLRLVEKPLRVLVLAPPFAVSDGASGAIVTWAGSRGSDFDVFAARVTHGGGLPWKGDVQVCAAPGDQFDMRMVPAGRGAENGRQASGSPMSALGAGGVVIGWLDSCPDGVRVSAQRLSHAGRPAWAPNGRIVGDATIVQPYWAPRSLLTMAEDGSGGAFLVWPNADPESELLAIRIHADGRAAPGWPEGGVAIHAGSGDLATADMANVGGGHAIVAWQYGGSSRATLLGPSGPAAWSNLTRVVTRDDPMVRPLSGDLPAARQEGSVAGRSLRLTPGTSEGCLRLMLTGGSPATLELFDILGRKVSSFEVGGLGGGQHEVMVGSGASLPPGVYVARVIQGSHRATARIVITH